MVDNVGIYQAIVHLCSLAQLMFLTRKELCDPWQSQGRQRCDSREWGGCRHVSPCVCRCHAFRRWRVCGYRSCRSYEIVRIKALVSRVFISAEAPQEEPTTYVIGDYQLDTLKEQLIFANENITATVIPLSHRESEILRLLCSNKGEVVDNKDVLLQLWGDDSYFNTRSLHVFITKLRRKLSRDPRVRIINVRGIGYKLIG